MGREIEIQSRGEIEIVNNRKAKIDVEEKQANLEKMIKELQKRVNELEGSK